MLTLYNRTIISLFALSGASFVHAEEGSEAPSSQAIAVASARVIVLCNVSPRPTPGCPTASLTFTSLSTSNPASPLAKASVPAALPAVVLNFE